MLGIYCLVAALYGVVIGSALNAYVWRLHAGTSWVRGKSVCESCGHELAGKDLVPLLSWLWLRGRCRYCRASLGYLHQAVEVSTAVLFALSIFALRPAGIHAWITTVIWLWLLVQLIILAVYDLRWMLLPNKVVLPAILVALLELVWLAITGSPLQVWLGPLEAAAIFGGAFYTLANVAGGRLMGGGDVKLVALMGLMLGVERTLLALFIAFDAAALISIALIATKRRKRTDYIPFGPFLIAGTIVAYLYGGTIISWYLHLNGI